MKMRLFPVVVFGFPFLVLLSCAPVYVPNVINAPLLSNKGEVQLSVYSATSGFDPQFACAVTDNIGIMVNGSFNELSYEDSDDYRKHKFFEMGAGYYQKLSEYLRFETFSGFGFGTIQANYSYSQWVSHATVNSKRFFIQPTLGATVQSLEGCFSARLVYLSLIQKEKSVPGFFFEPAMTGKLRHKRLKGIMQIGVSLPFAHYNLAFNYQPFIISIGLSVNLGKLND